MQTKNITEELHLILSSISAEGKEPTVALVKSRLSTPVPIPAIISTLKSWKSNQKVPKVEVASSSQTLTNEQRIADLEQQVQLLTERLDRLEK